MRSNSEFARHVISLTVTANQINSNYFFKYYKYFKYFLIMGTIRIENMEFYAFHGHFREEQIIGNKFIVDLTVEADMDKPGITDNLSDAVNYQEIYGVVKKEMEHKSNLLEHIATRILNALYSEIKGIKKATVKVSKMNPVMGGHIGRVSVEITR